MKNLTATIAVSKDNVEKLDVEYLSSRFGIKTSIGEETKIEKRLGDSAKANGIHAFRDARFITFEVPTNEIESVASLPYGLAPYMDDLQQAAKKYLAKFREDYIPVFNALPDSLEQKAKTTNWINKLNHLGYEAEETYYGMYIERGAYDAFKEIRRAENGN